MKKETDHYGRILLYLEFGRLNNVQRNKHTNKLYKTWTDSVRTFDAMGFVNYPLPTTRSIFTNIPIIPTWRIQERERYSELEYRI